ncbi:ATP-binding protein [Algoriphagus mannitolivorans]|uniref:ATP-binding protein n=1 Tax=Algoriphagus mannitolivorans TaxID=226504 RepID=UPI00047D35CA|nr:AAA family ATPase [Algoriphagus mannitolivorans]
MDQLVELYRKLLLKTSLDFVRSLEPKVRWENRLIGIMGSRGVGKTTLVLQHIKKNFSGKENKALYVSLDHIWFASNSIFELAEEFSKKGGELLVLDEVHKYPNWSQEIKNIYDFNPELQVIFTGSSLLEILNSRADLSRRALIFQMHGLSFREFLKIEAGLDFPVFSLESIIEQHADIAPKILENVRPFEYFSTYLAKGYYPFYREFEEMYDSQVRAIINLILEIELPQLRKFDVAYLPKIKQLLGIIADSVPFIPNVSKLSDKIGLNRTTLLTYLNYLAESKITANLYSDTKGISLLQKPEKLYLENTNLAFALGQNINEGNLRETFFLNQLSYGHQVTLPKKGDFLIDQKWLFEVGGKNKSLSSSDNMEIQIAADGIEIGHRNKIPLWLFGFLY